MHFLLLPFSFLSIVSNGAHMGFHPLLSINDYDYDYDYDYDSDYNITSFLPSMNCFTLVEIQHGIVDCDSCLILPSTNKKVN